MCALILLDKEVLQRVLALVFASNHTDERHELEAVVCVTHFLARGNNRVVLVDDVSHLEVKLQGYGGGLAGLEGEQPVGVKGDGLAGGYTKHTLAVLTLDDIERRVGDLLGVEYKRRAACWGVVLGGAHCDKCAMCPVGRHAVDIGVEIDGARLVAGFRLDFDGHGQVVKVEGVVTQAGGYLVGCTGVNF